jgi:hypothetical protein
MTDAAVSLKLPTFWTAQPRAWFIQVEAQFKLRGITQDSTQYAYVVAALDQHTAERLLDLLENPPATNLYMSLKNRLLASFSLSTRQRASRLLNMRGLGDRRPSELMDEMLALLGDHRPCLLFEELFRQQLPADVRMALEPIDFSDPRAAAQFADALWENRLQPSVVPVQLSEDTAVAAASRGDTMHSRPRTPWSSTTPDVCYYHRRFGRNARRCSPPCNFSAKSQPHSPQGNGPAGRR